MIGNLKILAVIPARGGSKGVPGKNIREVGGKPLLAWTIEAARNSKYIDRLVLSSDDPAIIQVAKNHGCEVPFVRPAKLAQDDTPGVDPVIHALESLPGFDLVVLLQPTSPLRTSLDIDQAIEKLIAQDAPVCVSVTEAHESPYRMFQLDDKAHLKPMIKAPFVARRQDLPKVFLLNGAVYVAKVDSFVKNRSFLIPETIGFETPAERSIDLDTEQDFLILNAILQTQRGPTK